MSVLLRCFTALTPTDLHHLAFPELAEVAPRSGAPAIRVLLRYLCKVLLRRDLGPQVHEHVDGFRLDVCIITCTHVS